MATHYRLYRNSGGGPSDPIDYATPIATGSGPPLSTPPLAAPGDYLLAVRARDPSSGLEDANADVVRLRIDAAGADVTALPNAPSGLSVRPFGNGRLLVRWSYNRGGQGGEPTGFKVWANAGAINYGLAPKATVAYARSESAYEAVLAGLSAGSHSVAVRATNATGDEPNTAAAAAATVATAGPSAVEGLVVAAIAG